MQIGNSGSSITELMAMLQQLYRSNSASTASSSSSSASTASSGSSASTTSQLAATATGVANSIAASSFLSSAPLSGDSLLTLLQTQSFNSASTSTVTGQVTDAAFAKWAATADSNDDGTISKSEFEAAVPSNITQAQADQLFNSIDTKGTGSVTAAQLRQGLTSAIAAGPTAPPPTGGTNRLFEALDTDGDGTITLKEFENDRASSVTQDQADATFAAFDLDGSGTLTPAEFGLALAEGSVTSASNSQTASAADASSVLGNWLNGAGGSASQAGALSILSQLPSGSTSDSNSISLLNGDVSNFVNILDTNQQSANSIQGSSSDLGDFLASLG
jgi:Ca2+-binding EF-hand superfamily protein